MPLLCSLFQLAGKSESRFCPEIQYKATFTFFNSRVSNHSHQEGVRVWDSWYWGIVTDKHTHFITEVFFYQCYLLKGVKGHKFIINIAIPIAISWEIIPIRCRGLNGATSGTIDNLT